MKDYVITPQTLNRSEYKVPYDNNILYVIVVRCDIQ